VINAVRLLLAFALTAAFGIHAFVRYKEISAGDRSPKQWAYWLYSVVFLFAAVCNFAALLVTIAAREYQRSPYHLGLLTLLLMATYLAFAAGERRRPAHWGS
jgi:hypothetical protein